MKHFLTATLLTLLITSCYKVNKPDAPDNLISEDKMVAVIIDMSLFTAAKGVDKKMLQNKGLDPNTYVYTKHGIDSTQFALSSEYYTYNVKQYKSIYTRVRDSLTILKKKYKVIDEREREEKRISDSISKAKRLDSLNVNKIKLKKGLIK